MTQYQDIPIGPGRFKRVEIQESPEPTNLKCRFLGEDLGVTATCSFCAARSEKKEVPVLRCEKRKLCTQTLPGKLGSKDLPCCVLCREKKEGYEPDPFAELPL